MKPEPGVEVVVAQRDLFDNSYFAKIGKVITIEGESAKVLLRDNNIKWFKVNDLELVKGECVSS
jgi:precorrin-6B methylase 2